MLVLEDYTWLIVVGAFGAFGFGYATGANDVANAFATSVGAKTLTLKQAVLIAAVFEFVGALVLGRVVTSTIASGIADGAVFKAEPEVYAYGMACALGVGTIWQLLASYGGFNVSATHSIIGSIIGFALVYKGSDAVHWAQKDHSGKSFPPYKGVVPIVFSWLFSPILTGFAAALFFWVCRTVVLRRPNGYAMSYWVLPPAVLITSWINMYFVFTKGAKKTLMKNDSSWDDNKSAWVSFVIAAGLAFLSAVVMIPYMKRKASRALENPTVAEPTAKVIDVESNPIKAPIGGESKEGAAYDVVKPNHQVVAMAPLSGSEMQKGSRLQKFAQASKSALTKGTNYDIHAVISEDPVVAKIHANAEVFDPRIEKVFSYLQVFSAICVIFAHGAGEVGYMAGPLNAIYAIVKTGKFQSKVDPKIWVLVICAFSLVAGLSTYGYNVMRAMGTEMAKLSATRGFAAELATALVIMIAAQYGLPTSSSQCITGGIIGVGLLEGVNGVNWRFFGKQFAMWALTLVFCGLGTAALFAQGVFSPSIASSN